MPDYQAWNKCFIQYLKFFYIMKFIACIAFTKLFVTGLNEYFYISSCYTTFTSWWMIILMTEVWTRNRNCWSYIIHAEKRLNFFMFARFHIPNLRWAAKIDTFILHHLNDVSNVSWLISHEKLYSCQYSLYKIGKFSALKWLTMAFCLNSPGRELHAAQRKMFKICYS